MSVTQRREHVELLSKSVRFSIALETIGLAKSSFYFKSKLSEIKNEKNLAPLDPKLQEILLSLKDYEKTLGYSKLTSYIQNNLKICFNKKKVYRHMKRLNLLQPKHIKKPKKKLKKLSIPFYCPLTSDQRWEADMTIISCSFGHVYLFTIIDTFDKQIIGQYISMRCRKEEAIECLKEAVYSRFPNGKILSTLQVSLRLDRGCQFTSEQFCNQATELGVCVEFCDVASPNQKPYIESFFSNFKREEVYRNDYSDFVEVSNTWKKYLNWYNQFRPHSSIKNLSPNQFRELISKKLSLNSLLPLSSL